MLVLVLSFGDIRFFLDVETCNINRKSVPVKRKCGFIDVSWKLFAARA